MKKGLLITLLFFGLMNQMKASHFEGSNIWYEMVGIDSFVFHYEFIRNCSGASAPTYITISYESASLSISNSFTSTLYHTDYSFPICSQSLNQSSCNGGSLFATIRYSYKTGVIVFPPSMQANDYIISSTSCCRGNQNTNLVNAGGYGMYCYTTFNCLGIANNSPRSVFNVQTVIPVNQTSQIDLHAIDPDGDSLVYVLDNALDVAAFLIPYNPGYSAQQPIASTPGCFLDPQTGILYVTPTNIENDALAYNILEYRNGVLISTTHFEKNIQTVAGTGNQIPTLSGINGTNNFTTSVSANQTLSFTVNTADADIADSTIVRFDSTVNASLSLSSAQNAVGTFSWTPTAADVRPYPYVISFTVYDNACPYMGNQSYAFLIYVNQANTDTVWPGDANADYSDDLYDVLSLGVAYGTTGATRAGANITWSPQWCANWVDTFASGINFKHSDTNGDGIVDANDTLAIINNLGSTHLRMGGAESTGGLMLYAQFSPVYDGWSPFSFPIFLDGNGSGIDSIYGLSYTINWPVDTLDVNQTSITQAGTLFDNNSGNCLNIEHADFPNGKMNVAQVRTNHAAVAVNHNVAYFNSMLSSQAALTTMITPHFSNIHAIDKFGNEMEIGTTDNPIYFQWEGIPEVPNNLKLNVYPNPTDNIVQLQVNNISSNQNIEVKLMDVTGRVVLTQNISSTELEKGIQLSLANLPDSMYEVMLFSNGNSLATQRLVKE